MSVLAGETIPSPLAMVGNHQYLLDGDPVPGVTTIIRGGVPAPALVWWAGETVAKYVAAEPEQVARLRAIGTDELVYHLARVPNRTRDAAGVKGTAVHELGERVVHGHEVGPDDIPDGLDPAVVLAHVRTYAEWLDRFSVVPVYSECMIANRRHRYAGKFDLLARIGSETWLLDLKTSKGVYGDTSLQVEAYARGQFLVTPEGQTLDLPRVDRIGVVHVTRDATHLYPLDREPGARDAAFTEFLAAKVIADGEDRRRRLIDRKNPRPLRVEDIS